MNREKPALGMEAIAVIQPATGGPNPYVRLLRTHLDALENVNVLTYDEKHFTDSLPKVWHLHFPGRVLETRSALYAALRCLVYLLRLKRLRRRGLRIVWTIHNLISHDSRHPGIERRFKAGLCNTVDGWISMSQIGKEDAEREFPSLSEKPSAVIPHGHYREIYACELSHEEARRVLELGDDEQVLLFFGKIRPYKNVVRLIECFRDLEGKVRLIIAGYPEEVDLELEIKRVAEADPRILLRLGRIADDDVQMYFRAADLVVLPFIRITNSGSAVLSLSFDVPTLVPDLGGMAELAADVGEGWLRTYEGELTSRILREGLEWARDVSKTPGPSLEKLSWEKIAASTLSFYQSVLTG